MGDNNIESYCRVVSCWVESSVVADAKTLLTHKWYPKTYKKYEIFCRFQAFCLSLQKIVCLRQNEA